MLLDPEVIARAESLGLQARFIVEGYMAGEHKSPYRGFAAEFAQHREYTPGEDIRHIDWKLLGRTDRLYIKQYEQETNFAAHILLDGSASMNYGSGEVTKLAYGKTMAACLAYLVLLQRDAVSLGIFDSEIRDYAPRSDNRQSIHKLVEMLARFETAMTTNIAQALQETVSKIQRKGIVIVISDFLDDDQGIMKGLQHLRFAGHEIVVFHLLDPHELEFPFNGLVEFEGLEDHTRIETRPADIRRSYLRELEAFCARLRQGCESNQCDYIRVNTGKPLSEVLSGYLAFRHRVAR